MYEESRRLVVVGKTQKDPYIKIPVVLYSIHQIYEMKDAFGKIQYTPDFERCIWKKYIDLNISHGCDQKMPRRNQDLLTKFSSHYSLG